MLTFSRKAAQELRERDHRPPRPHHPRPGGHDLPRLRLRAAAPRAAGPGGAAAAPAVRPRAGPRGRPAARGRARGRRRAAGPSALRPGAAAARVPPGAARPAAAGAGARGRRRARSPRWAGCAGAPTGWPPGGSSTGYDARFDLDPTAEVLDYAGLVRAGRRAARGRPRAARGRAARPGGRPRRRAARTPTRRSCGCCRRSPATAATSWPSATPTSRSTPSAAPTSRGILRFRDAVPAPAPASRRPSSCCAPAGAPGPPCSPPRGRSRRRLPAGALGPGFRELAPDPAAVAGPGCGRGAARRPRRPPRRRWSPTCCAGPTCTTACRGRDMAVLLRSTPRSLAVAAPRPARRGGARRRPARRAAARRGAAWCRRCSTCSCAALRPDEVDEPAAPRAAAGPAGARRRARGAPAAPRAARRRPRRRRQRRVRRAARRRRPRPAGGPAAAAPRSAARSRSSTGSLRRSGAAAEAGTAEEVLWAAWEAVPARAPAGRREPRRAAPRGAVADRALDSVIALFDAAARYVDRLPGRSALGFLDDVAAQEVPGDTLAQRTPEGDARARAHRPRQQGPRVAGGRRRRGAGGGLARPAAARLAARRRRARRRCRRRRCPTLPGDRRAALLDEERRLFYVAATRARERLVVTAVAGGESGDDRPSRFLAELGVPRARARPCAVGAPADRAPGCSPSCARSRPAPPTRRCARRPAAGSPCSPARRAPTTTCRPSPLAAPRPLVGPRAAVRRRRRSSRDDEQLRVSPSKVESFDTCSLRWFLESAVGRRRLRPARRRCSARWCTRSPSSPAAPRRSTCPRSRRGSTPCCPSSTSARPGRCAGGARRPSSSSRKFVRWAAANPRELVAVELQLLVPLGERAVLSGRVDRLERDAQGRAVVVDLKTGASKPSQGRARPPPAARRLPAGRGPRRVRRRARPHRVRRRRAAAAARRARQADEQAQPALADDDDPGWARDLVERVVEGMSGAAFPAAVNEHCRTCAVRTSCPAWPEGAGGAAVTAAATDAVPRAGRCRSTGSARCSASGSATSRPRSCTAPLEAGVVVAGAGSGKTATMVARVAWLVGSGLVAPDQVLGPDLHQQGRRRAGRPRAAGAAPAAGGRAAARRAGRRAADLEPVVSTYHAYAGRLVRDHALRLGREPGARLVTPATSWQLAARAVATYDGPMDAVSWAESTVVQAVLRSPATCPSTSSSRRRSARSGAAAGAAPTPRPRCRRRRARCSACQAAREQLLPLVERYAAAKRERELLDFGDVVALAARLARDCPEVREVERAAARVVLLDEYQDTGAAQEVLLSSLFGDGHAGHRRRRPLPEHLRLARRQRRHAAALPDAVRRRAHRARARCARPTATAGASCCSPTPCRDDAARRGRPRARRCGRRPAREDDGAGALRAAARRRRRGRLGRRRGRRRAPAAAARPTAPHWSRAAVLCRKRSMFPRLRAAFEQRGVPVEVVGLGGLLAVPEVADLRRDAAGARRPHGRRRPAAAAHRPALAARPARPRRPRPPGPRAGAQRRRRRPTTRCRRWCSGSTTPRSARWSTPSTTCRRAGDARPAVARGPAPARGAARRAARAAPPRSTSRCPTSSPTSSARSASTSRCRPGPAPAARGRPRRPRRLRRRRRAPSPATPRRTAPASACCRRSSPTSRPPRTRRTGSTPAPPAAPTPSS